MVRAFRGGGCLSLAFGWRLLPGNTALVVIDGVSAPSIKVFHRRAGSVPSGTLENELVSRIARTLGCQMLEKIVYSDEIEMESQRRAVDSEQSVAQGRGDRRSPLTREVGIMERCG